MVFYITFIISPVTGSPFRGPCAARRSVKIRSHFLSVSPPGPPAWYHIQSSWISKLLWIYYLGESACFKLVTVLIFWLFSKMELWWFSKYLFCIFNLDWQQIVKIFTLTRPSMAIIVRRIWIQLYCCTKLNSLSVYGDVLAERPVAISTTTLRLADVN